MADRNWARRLALRLQPEVIDYNMSVRARLWRATTDWAWGIELKTPYWRRLLWVWRRMVQ